MAAPASVKIIEGGQSSQDPIPLALTPSGLFSTAVGPPSKKTLAAWHVTSAHEVVDSMLRLVGAPVPERRATLSGAATPAPFHL